MSLLNRLFGSPGPDPKVRLLSLYDQIVAKAREPHWYVEGQVPDSIDGRFDMVSAVLALVLMRLEDSADHSPDMARLTEVFVDDMDGQMREAGIGDVIVGKHIGKMMSALGGRLAAFRAARTDATLLDSAILRNIYRTETVSPDALSHVREQILLLDRSLATQVPEKIVEGAIQW